MSTFSIYEQFKDTLFYGNVAEAERFVPSLRGKMTRRQIWRIVNDALCSCYFAATPSDCVNILKLVLGEFCMDWRVEYRPWRGTFLIQICSHGYKSSHARRIRGSQRTFEEVQKHERNYPAVFDYLMTFTCLSRFVVRHHRKVIATERSTITLALPPGLVVDLMALV